MKNKVLITLVAVLLAALIFETAYLLGSRQRVVNHKNVAVAPHVSALYQTPRNNIIDYDFSAFDDMSNWDPFAEMERIQQRMHRIFDDSFSKGLTNKTIFRADVAFEPNVSISQKDDVYIIKTDLPGMDKDTINVVIKGKELLISGERKENTSKQEKGFYRQELNYGAFSRSIILPDDARANQITSEYKNGVLTITIPREKTNKIVAPTIKVPVQ